MNGWLSSAARMPDKEGKAASKKSPRSRVELANVSGHKSPYEGEVTITIQLHDVIYFIICLLNQFPILCYFGTASVYIPRDQQAVYEINGSFPMLAAASAAICMMNLLSIFKIK